jgi:hypothetical protein
MHGIVRKNLLVRISTILATACLFCGPLAVARAASPTAASAPDSNWKQVEDAMGRPGQMQPADVIKFGSLERISTSCLTVSILRRDWPWVHGQLSNGMAAARW